MNKKLKIITNLAAVICLATSISACGSKDAPKDVTTDTPAQEESKVLASYTYNDGINPKADVEVKKVPKKAITLSQFMSEMLLALGLEDNMAAVGLLDNDVLPEYKEAYDKIPKIEVGSGHVFSKESFLSYSPDFISGWDKTISAETTGTPEELLSKDIYPYFALSQSGDSTIETVYKDFELLGKIFNVEDKATEVISNLKNKIADVEKKVTNIPEEDKLKVAVYCSGEDQAYTVTDGYPNDLIERAGGINVTKGAVDSDYGYVSLEKLAAENPDVIIITDYNSSTPIEEKINFFKTHPALKEIKAVKEDKIVVMGLADFAPGVRCAGAIEQINSALYEKAN